MSATMTKVTSLGSQYSTSNTPSAPNPTPATESLDNEAVDPPPPMDFAAVARILGPIQETLNESAVEAMYPSPPINSPIYSPTPSVCWYPSRRRGISSIVDRLAQLKFDDRKFPSRDMDVSSNRSVELSVAEDEECDVASISEVLSDGGKDKHGPGQGGMSLAPLASPTGEGSVRIALGSPTVNPLIEEYLSFNSKDLPAKPPAAGFVSTPVENTSLSNKTAIDNESLKSRTSIKNEDGVTEKSNWAEEVDEILDRACMRLEQLARDLSETDSSMSMEEHYMFHLASVLSSNKRIVPVGLQKKPTGQQE